MEDIFGDIPLDASVSDAIASIESGGRYDILGPTTKSGDRAYGKYQVMGANVGPWTKKYLGQELTPEQFLQSPDAQESVFNGEFGRLATRYGPSGAARAWFAGEGGMNKPSRKDALGTSVDSYERKFLDAFTRQPQVAGTTAMSFAEEPRTAMAGQEQAIRIEPAGTFAAQPSATAVSSGGLFDHIP